MDLSGFGLGVIPFRDYWPDSWVMWLVQSME
jgi:hypothetical protein